MTNSRIDSLAVRITIEGDDAKRILEEIGKTGEKAGKSLEHGSHGANDAFEELSHGAEHLITIFDEFERGQKGAIFSTLGSVLKGLSSPIGATVGALGVLSAAFLGLSASGSSAASELKEASIRLGVSAQDFSGIKFAFEQSGSGAEGFEKAVGVIHEAAGTLSTSADETEKAQKKIADAGANTAKTIKEAIEARNLTIEKAQQSHNDRMTDLAVKQAREERDAVAKGAVDIFELRKKQSGQTRDTSEDESRSLQRTARDANEALARTQKKAFDDRREKLAEFNKSIEDAADQAARSTAAFSGDPAQKFKQLGVELTEVGGRARDPVEVLKDVADKIEALPDAATRSQAAIALFGRRIGGQLVESLQEGRKGLEELAKEAEHLGLIFSDPQLKIGKKFEDDLKKLTGTIKATSDKIGLEFAPLFDTVIDAMAKSFGHAQAPIVAAAHSLADVLKPVFADLVKVIEGDFEAINSLFIKTFVEGFRIALAPIKEIGGGIADLAIILYKSFEQISLAIKDFTGVNIPTGDLIAFTAAAYLAVPALGALGGAFTFLAANPAVIIAGLVLLDIELLRQTHTWETFTGTLQGAKEIIVGVFTIVKDWAVRQLTAVLAFFTETRDAFVGIMQSISDSWNNFWQSMADWAIGKLTDIGNFLLNLKDRALEVLGLSDKASATAAAGGPLAISRSGGGGVPGSGSGDTVPAWLTPGEYVMRTSAVNTYGVGIMRALNSLSLPVGAVRSMFRGGNAYALGGMVLPSPQRFAFGGLAGERVPTYVDPHSRQGINLFIGDEVFGMDTDRGTAERLTRFSSRDRRLGGGSLPGWYAGGKRG